MRPVEFGGALPTGTPLTLYSDDKPDRFFTVIKRWMDQTSGIALVLRTGVPSYQVEDEEGRIHLLIHLPTEEENEDSFCLWRPDQAGFDSRSIFDGGLPVSKRKGNYLLFSVAWLPLSVREGHYSLFHHIEIPPQNPMFPLILRSRLGLKHRRCGQSKR